MDDKTIWDDFLNGQKSALSHIYFQNVKYLYQYGRKFSSDSELVKDTIQDLFLDLIRTRENLGKTDNIKLYLVKSFRWKLLKFISKQRLTFSPAMNYANSEVSCSAEDVLIDHEKQTLRDQIVQKALKELSHRMQEILYYRYGCDFEYNQICEIMGIRYDSARKMVFRALKALRKKLNNNVMENI